MASDNITPFTGETTLKINPDQVLRANVGNYPNGVLLIGWDANEELIYSTSIDDAKDLLWLLENAKRSILDKFGE
jgi:hypothetical protein